MAHQARLVLSTSFAMDGYHLDVQARLGDVGLLRCVSGSGTAAAESDPASGETQQGDAQ
jgi:hypothetical protein